MVSLHESRTHLNADIVTENTTFGATGTPSTMVRSGGTITVTLGTLSSGKVREELKKTTPITWTPSTSAFDRAGNANTAASVDESGALDVSF